MVSADVDDRSDIARALTQRRNHICENPLGVRPAAFMPCPNAQGKLETSAYCTAELEEQAVANLFSLSLLSRTVPKVCGYAVFRPDLVKRAKLELHVGWDPPRHVALQGWSSDKSENLSRCQVLAGAAKLIRFEPPLLFTADSVE